MKIFIQYIIILVMSAMAAAAMGPDAECIVNLGKNDRGTQEQAQAQCLQAGAEAVPALVTVLNKGDQPAAKMADETLMRMAAENADTDRQASIAKAMAEALGGEIGDDTRMHLCRYLSLIGGDESVESLASLLDGDNAHLYERARWALERIPGEAATEALMTQLKKDDASSDRRIALINGLGARGAKNAVPVLKEQLEAGDPQVVAAALNALAAIPTAQSFTIMRDAYRSKLPGAEVALFTLAENLVDANMSFQAMALLVPVWSDAQASVTLKCRALHGLARTGSAPTTDIVLNALDHENPRIQEAAVQACMLIEGKEEQNRLGYKAMTADKPLRLELIREVGAQNAVGQLFLLQEASAADDAEIRAAAYEAMGKLSVPNEPEALMAALKAKLNDDARHLKCTPLVYTSLLAGLKDDDESVRRAAEQSLMYLSDEAVTERLIDAYDRANDRQTASILTVLGRRHGAAADALLLKEVDNKNDAIRAAAAGGLGRMELEKGKLPSAEVTDALVAAADEGPDNVRAAAVDSLLCLAQRRNEVDQAWASGLYVKALTHAVSDQQKRSAMIGISENTDPKQTELLAVIEPLVFEGSLTRPAAQAAAQFAMHLPDSEKDRAEKILIQAVKLKTDNALDAVEYLRDELGIDFDPSRTERGFITVYWLAGPLPNPNHDGFDTVYFPEKQVDLAAREKVGDATIGWQRVRTLADDGRFDLRKLISERGHAVTYAYAEVAVDKAQDALLKMGSDDGLAAWVNGDKVHAMKVSRGLTVDGDVVPIKLKEGVNRILLKITDNGGYWEFTARLTTPDNQPLKFEQKMDADKTPGS